MPYSELEQRTTDIDIYFKDSNKNVHLASGGGRLPSFLIDDDTRNDSFKQNLELDENGNFEIEINPELGTILELNENELAQYLEDFVLHAKNGFYTYDKTNLGNFENDQFHLVARPRYINSSRLDYNSISLKSNVTMPDGFSVFSLNNIDPENGNS